MGIISGSDFQRSQIDVLRGRVEINVSDGVTRGMVRLNDPPRIMAMGASFNGVLETQFNDFNELFGALKCKSSGAYGTSFETLRGLGFSLERGDSRIMLDTKKLWAALDSDDTRADIGYILRKDEKSLKGSEQKQALFNLMIGRTILGDTVLVGDKKTGSIFVSQNLVGTIRSVFVNFLYKYFRLNPNSIYSLESFITSRGVDEVENVLLETYRCIVVPLTVAILSSIRPKHAKFVTSEQFVAVDIKYGLNKLGDDSARAIAQAAYLIQIANYLFPSNQFIGAKEAFVDKVIEGLAQERREITVANRRRPNKDYLEELVSSGDAKSAKKESSDLEAAVVEDQGNTFGIKVMDSLRESSANFDKVKVAWHIDSIS